MSEGVTGAGWRDWTAALLPAVVVVLFGLLHRALPGPTAAGLSFLAVIVVAYLFFPKIKLDGVKVVIGVALALVVAVALVAGFGRL